jgi:bacterial/archaeal transporter family-2 protein
VIAGNLAMAAVIDHFGLFGQEEIELGWPRLVGLGLLAAGSALSLANT